MRSNAILRIVLYSIAILILVSILAGCLLLNTFMVNTDWESIFTAENTGNVASAGSVSAQEIRSILVEWAAGTITVQPGDVENIEFYETVGLPEEQQMVWSRKGSQLQIRFAKTRVYFGISIDKPKDLVIVVPRNWICGELEIDAASAKVTVSDMTIETVDFDGASGVCQFTNCDVGQFDVDTASGDILFEGTLYEMDCDAASATCTLDLLSCPRRIDADMASGDLRLTLPEDSGFVLELDALSGDFTSDFPTTTKNGKYLYGDERCSIHVSALSGDVVIYKESAAE